MTSLINRMTRWYATATFAAPNLSAAAPVNGASVPAGSGVLPAVGIALGSADADAEAAVEAVRCGAVLRGIAALLLVEQPEPSVATTKAAANTKATWVWGERDQPAAAFGDQLRLGT